MWMLDAVARPLNRLPGAHGKGSTTGQRHTSPLHAWRARRMNHCAFFRETELLSFAIRRGTSFRKGSKKEEKEKEKLLSMHFVKENFWRWRRIAFLWGASKGLEKKLDPRMDLWNRWREFLVAFLQGKNCFPSEGGGESRFERGEVALDSTRGWILLDEKKIFNSELLSFEWLSNRHGSKGEFATKKISHSIFSRSCFPLKQLAWKGRSSFRFDSRTRRQNF